MGAVPNRALKSSPPCIAAVEPSARAMLEGQNRILELIAKNGPLTETLEAIALLIESRAPETRCSILLLRDNRLHHGAAPSLPPEFSRAVEGLQIGPAVCSCGTAAFRKQPVIASDIATDPLWAPEQRAFTVSFGLRSCWSTPIVSNDQTVLGTFAIYSLSPSVPTSKHAKLIEVATHMARIAIERHLADESLKERARQLAEADRRKDEFIALLAHELRNPLAPMLMALEVVRLQNYDKATVEKYIDMLDRQVHHLKRLIDDLLDVSRITRGKIELKREHVPVESVCARAIELSMPLVQARQHRMHVDMPQPSPTAWIDAVRMAQVVSNLVNNAALYSPPSSDIFLSAAQENGAVLIKVRDTGYGMSSEMLERAFDLFVQGDRSRAREQGGLGVGLALVRGIVELHGGRVRAESDGLGKGSEFTVVIPADDAIGV